MKVSDKILDYWNDNTKKAAERLLKCDDHRRRIDLIRAVFYMPKTGTSLDESARANCRKRLENGEFEISNTDMLPLWMCRGGSGYRAVVIKKKGDNGVQLPQIWKSTKLASKSVSPDYVVIGMMDSTSTDNCIWSVIKKYFKEEYPERDVGDPVFSILEDGSIERFPKADAALEATAEEAAPMDGNNTAADAKKHNEYVTLLKANRNLILHGAPGTGKTYLAKEIAEAMGCEGDHIGFVQFHPSYDYTDFVEGLRPVQDGKGNVGFKRVDGVFKSFCAKALQTQGKEDGKPPFVFIIDEINRGEMSKIFGELFFSIDPGYRGEKGKVKTQYANMVGEPNEFDKKLNHVKDGNYGWFFVPENVYIIGTMNDIDRSVESMDFAMRRRFAFKEITAESQMGMLDRDKAWKDYGEKPDKVDDIGKCMKRLNEAIGKCEGLSSAYHIGASYFLKYALYDGKDAAEAFKALWNNHLEGLLKEYLRGIDPDGKKLKNLKEAYDNPKPDNSKSDSTPATPADGNENAQ